jgi:hypothetical protein
MRRRTFITVEDGAAAVRPLVGRRQTLLVVGFLRVSSFA